MCASSRAHEETALVTRKSSPPALATGALSSSSSSEPEVEEDVERIDPSTDPGIGERYVSEDEREEEREEEGQTSGCVGEKAGSVPFERLYREDAESFIRFFMMLQDTHTNLPTIEHGAPI